MAAHLHANTLMRAPKSQDFKARYYGRAAVEHRRGVVQTYLFNLSSVIGSTANFPLSAALFSRIVA
jgi:hypothetical protein